MPILNKKTGANKHAERREKPKTSSLLPEYFRNSLLVSDDILNVIVKRIVISVVGKPINIMPSNRTEKL